MINGNVSEKTTAQARLFRNNLQDKIKNDMAEFTRVTGCPIRGVVFEKKGGGISVNGTEIVEDYNIRLEVDL